MRQVYLTHESDGEWSAVIPEGWRFRLGVNDEGQGCLWAEGPDEGPVPTVERVA